jgi:hypothetical protein
MSNVNPGNKMKNHTVIMSSQLGTNCWLPYRFLGTCYKCQRFDICTYPEKNVKPEHQRVLDRMNKARQSIKQKEKEIWNYKVLLGLPVPDAKLKRR